MFVIWNIAFYCHQMNKAFIDVMDKKWFQPLVWVKRKRELHTWKQEKKWYKQRLLNNKYETWALYYTWNVNRVNTTENCMYTLHKDTYIIQSFGNNTSIIWYMDILLHRWKLLYSTWFKLIPQWEQQKRKKNEESR